jgi:hypothetical protein
MHPRDLGIPGVTSIAEAAALAARKRHGGAAPTPEPPEPQADDVRAVTRRYVDDPMWDEDDEQALIMKLFRAHGCIVRSTSQKRRSAVALGLPDLIVHHVGAGKAWRWESKYGPRAKLSPAQRQFIADERACRQLVGVGDLWAAGEWLVHLGIASIPALRELPEFRHWTPAASATP